MVLKGGWRGPRPSCGGVGSRRVRGVSPNYVIKLVGILTYLVDRNISKS